MATRRTQQRPRPTSTSRTRPCSTSCGASTPRQQRSTVQAEASQATARRPTTTSCPTSRWPPPASPSSSTTLALLAWCAASSACSAMSRMPSTTAWRTATASMTLSRPPRSSLVRHRHPEDRKSTRLNSSHVEISYAVFCLKKKKKKKVLYSHYKKEKKKQKL